MPNGSVEFLASVSTHCRKMTELAGLAIRNKEDYESSGARKGLQAALVTQRNTLYSLLPDDFPKGRQGDLNRHIKFCEPNDWYDIVLLDIPDILAKAEVYARGMSTGDLSSLDQFLHTSFRPRVELAVQAAEPNYHDLVVACCTALASQFTRKSGAKDDSDGEIGRVFSPNNPVLLIPENLDTETNRNRQRGAMQLMQGWRAFIRNPHAHGERPTDKEYAVHALMLMSFLGRLIDAAAVRGDDDE